MRRPTHFRRPARGFALISTLLIIAILTIMVVAFMQSMRVDRLTSRAYMNRFRAELAAQSAANLAIAQVKKGILDPVSGADVRTFTVESFPVLNPSPATPPTAADPVEYSPVVTITRYQANATTGALDAVRQPLMSTSVSSADFESDFSGSLAKLYKERANVSKTVSLVNLNRGELIQSEASLDAASFVKATYYKVPMVNLNAQSGTVTARMGMMVLDDQARLNPACHQGAARTGWGKTAAEIPLSLATATKLDDTLLSNAEMEGIPWPSAADPPPDPLIRLVPYALAGIFSTPARAKDRKHLFASYNVANEDVIPAGYPGAGKPKYDINDLALNPAHGATATARAENIAAIISQELPNFKTRDPSFAAAGAAGQQFKYVNRVAASIVDYIDPDKDTSIVNKDPAVASSGEPAGRELVPMVSGIAENFQWLSKGVAPDFICTFQSRYYVQLWNPYTETVSGNVRLEIRKRPALQVGNAIEQHLKDYTESASGITIRPNEFVVVEFPAVAEDPRQSNKDPELNSKGIDRPQWQETKSADPFKDPHPYFKMYWNGTLADMNRRDPEISGDPVTSGLPKGQVAVANNPPSTKLNRIIVGANRWSVHFMQHTAGGDGSSRHVNDPRISYISNYDWTEWVNSSYDNGYWGGRQDHVTTTQDFQTKLSPRDGVRANPNTGAVTKLVGIPALPDITKTPLQLAGGAVYDQATDGRNAPFYIRNDRMESIGELGNIFDPAQAGDTGKASVSAGAGSYGSGGGRSLCIGRPEFSFTDSTLNWDVEGKRAIQLLDIFTTNQVASGATYPEMKGRININTAPKEVLMALFFNVTAGSDEGMDPAEYAPGDAGKPAPTIDRAKAELFAKGVIAERENMAAGHGPFQRLSDLRRILPLFQIRSNYEPELISASPPSTLGPTDTDVMDRAREEAFAKIVNLVTTQSRALRIYTAGQALGPTGQVAASAVIETRVVLEPYTNSAGLEKFNVRVTDQFIR